MKTQTNTRKPAYEAFVIEGEGETAYWTKVGAAWASKDGKGLQVKLTALPLDGRLVLRAPRPASHDE